MAGSTTRTWNNNNNSNYACDERSPDFTAFVLTIPLQGCPPNVTCRPVVVQTGGCGIGTFNITLTLGGSRRFYACALTVQYTVVVLPRVRAHFASPPRTSATAGSYYVSGAKVLATGGGEHFSFAATGLPPGLDIDANGVIFGQPTAFGQYQVAIQAIDVLTGGVAQLPSLPLMVYEQLVEQDTVRSATANNRFCLQMPTVYGGYMLNNTSMPYNVLLEGVPPELTDVTLPTTLGNSSQLCARATTPGQLFFSIVQTDRNGASLRKRMSLSVSPELHVIINSSDASLAASSPSSSVSADGASTLETGVRDRPFRSALRVGVEGGHGVITLRLDNEPAGLTIDADGFVSGTPLVAGVFDISVVATDENSAVDRVPLFTLSVAAIDANARASTNFMNTSNIIIFVLLAVIVIVICVSVVLLRRLVYL